MTAETRKRAVAKVSTADDTITAEGIVRELCRGEPAPAAVDYVKSRIVELRAFTTARRAKPKSRPSDAKKINKQIAGHAEALLSCIEKLGPDWPDAYVYKFWPWLPAVNDPGFEKSALEAEMDKFIHYLKQMPFSRQELIRLRPKDECVFTTYRIIEKLAPTTKLTKSDGSTLYLIASWLWEAATGEITSLKRLCDVYMDTFKLWQKDEIERQEFLHRTD